MTNNIEMETQIEKYKDMTGVELLLKLQLSENRIAELEKCKAEQTSGCMLSHDKNDCIPGKLVVGKRFDGNHLKLAQKSLRSQRKRLGSLTV